MCAYHPKTKIPTICCITDNKIRTTHFQAASTLAQQPSNKGRKRVIFCEPDQTTTPAAYASNLNTSQQELVCKRAHHPLYGKTAKHKRSTYYSKSVPMVWDPKTKLVSPKFCVMLDNNFNTVQAPDPNITQADTMDRLFKTNRYKYDDPF
jgi:hypothetical protein